MKLPGWWRKNFLNVELLLVLVLMLLLVGYSECFQGRVFIEKLLEGNRASIYGALLSVFASLLGFTITAASIVLGFANSPKLEVVRNSQHYPTLWKVFSATIRTFGIATIIALIGLIFDRDKVNNIDRSQIVVFYFLVLYFLLSTARTIRSVWVLEKVIQILTKNTTQKS